MPSYYSVIPQEGRKRKMRSVIKQMIQLLTNYWSNNAISMHGTSQYHWPEHTCRHHQWTDGMAHTPCVQSHSSGRQQHGEGACAWWSGLSHGCSTMHKTVQDSHINSRWLLSEHSKLPDIFSPGVPKYCKSSHRPKIVQNNVWAYCLTLLAMQLVIYIL